MYNANLCKRYPYYEIFAIYLKCENEEHKCLVKNMIANMYPEIIDIVIPIYNDHVYNTYMNFNVIVQEGDAFYRQQKHTDCYGWSTSVLTINVPYGNIINHRNASDNWLSKTARTLKGIIHGTRLLTNESPDFRHHVNINIPWIPMDKLASKCTLEELRDYYEVVLSMLSSNTWVRSKEFIIQHK